MLGLCFAYDQNARTRNEWAFLIDWFGVTDSWEYGKPDDVDGYPKSTGITTSAELPDKPLVVLTPAEARTVKGTQCLHDFVHPEEAIYMTGGNHVHMAESPMFNGRDYQTVYIPVDQYELYAIFAATMAFYDRRHKAWGP